MCYNLFEMLANKHVRNTYTSLRRGLTLIEISVVIVVLLTLIGVSIYAVSGYRDWQLSTEGTQKLRMVYNAQRTYLSENPTDPVSTLTDEKIIPYLSDNGSVIPTVEGLDGVNYNIQVNVSPPVIINAGGGIYDPSGSSNDGVWDVGR